MDRWDAVAITGVAAVVYGCYLIYPPLAWIVGGSVAAAVAYLAEGHSDDS